MSHGSWKIPRYVILSILTLIAVFPTLWMLSISLRPNTQVFVVPPQLLPQQPTGSAYRTVLSNPTNLRFFLNSYFIGLAVTVLAVGIGLFSGYGFSRFKFRGRNALILFVVLTQMIPPITLVIPYFGMIVRVHLYNSYAGLILTYLSFALPYSILMMSGYLSTISRELDEAAIVDGCSRTRALISIIMPVAVPGMVSAAVYTFLLSWNEYLFALTLTNTTNMRTVPVGLSLLQGQFGVKWNVMMSFSILASIPVLVLFVVVQRYFMAGLTSGATKG